MFLVCQYAKMNMRKNGKISIHIVLMLMFFSIVLGFERDIVKSPNELVYSLL